MIRRRPLRFWLVAAAFAAAILGWTLYVPYAPAMLYAPIPAGATFISEHRDLAVRWESFSKNPLMLSLFASLGIEPSALKDLTEDPESRAWFERLAARDVVLAQVPALGNYSEPAWVFASWLGGRSQRLRWSLSWGDVPGFVRQTPHRGRTYWRVASPYLRPGLVLTVALEEGILIGCLSRHTDTMQDVLDTFDGILPSAGMRGRSRAAGPWCSTRPEADCGWVDLSGVAEGESLAPPSVTYEFSEVMPGSLAGQACGELPVEFPPAPAGGLETGGLDGLLGDLPIAVTVMNTALLGPFTEARVRPLWLHLLGEVVHDQKAGVFAASLLSGDYSGRLKGIKIPALVVGIPAADGEAALAWARAALDRLNARYRWGLIPQELPAGDGEVFAVSGTGEGIYATLAPEEQAAYAFHGGWLLLASNAGCLQRLIERRHGDGAVPEPGRARWMEGLNEVQAPCYGWIDLARGGKTLRLAVTTYSLKLLMEDPRGSQKPRERLNEAKAWIDSFAPLDTCRFWLRSDGHTVNVSFKAGEQTASDQ